MDQPTILLRKAHKYLRSAAVLLEMEDYDSCVSRAYFAMLYAAQSLLLVRGRRVDQGIRTAFIDAFVASGQLPERAGNALNLAHDMMEVADYAHSFSTSEPEAVRILQEAEAFVHSLHRLVHPDGVAELVA